MPGPPARRWQVPLLSVNCFYDFYFYSCIKSGRTLNALVARGYGGFIRTVRLLRRIVQILGKYLFTCRHLLSVGPRGPVLISKLLNSELMTFELLVFKRLAFALLSLKGPRLVVCIDSGVPSGALGSYCVFTFEIFRLSEFKRIFANKREVGVTVGLTNLTVTDSKAPHVGLIHGRKLSEIARALVNVNNSMSLVTYGARGVFGEPREPLGTRECPLEVLEVLDIAVKFKNLGQWLSPGTFGSPRGSGEPLGPLEVFLEFLGTIVVPTDGLTGSAHTGSATRSSTRRSPRPACTTLGGIQTALYTSCARALSLSLSCALVLLSSLALPVWPRFVPLLCPPRCPPRPLGVRLSSSVCLSSSVSLSPCVCLRLCLRLCLSLCLCQSLSLSLSSRPCWPSLSGWLRFSLWRCPSLVCPSGSSRSSQSCSKSCFSVSLCLSPLLSWLKRWLKSRQ